MSSLGLDYKYRKIDVENPTAQELGEWYHRSGLPLKRFFNTSGLVYKELGLSKKLPDISEEEQLRILGTNGMLVKRPILLLEDGQVYVGKDVASYLDTLENP